MGSTYLDDCVESGRDSGQGNLLGIQPYLTPDNYASADQLRAALGVYLAAARERGWLGPKSVAVFPEYCGTWLVAAGEKPAVYAAATTAAAMRPLALGRPFAFLRQLLAAREQDRLTAAIFRLKAVQTARLYQEVFSALAREFRVTLVAGSAILPDPRVKAGELRAGSGPLYNAAAVFRTDGSLYPQVTRKVYPISAEQPFISGSPADELPVYETPAGRLGVLVCADSWYPDPYRALGEKRVELLAVPSLVTGNGVWESPWGGYDGALAPEGVQAADVGRLTEGQAWRKYALAGRFAASGARAGINVFLHGSLWDLGTDSGRTLGLGPGGAVETSSRCGALVNIWL